MTEHEREEQARAIRDAAQSTGGRVLEMHAGTPRLNEWYYSKFRDRIRGDVLELGCGIGNISRLLARDADTLVATDVEDTYLGPLRDELGSDRVDVTSFDLEGEPPRTISERRFDVVLSMNVLEHVLDDAGAVRRLVRLLRPGGYMLTYVPAMPFAFSAMDANLGHHRRYTTQSFGGLMRAGGLAIERLEYMNVLGLLGWWVNGKILRRQVADPAQVKTFERLVPLVRLEDRFRVPVGLGVIAHARKPSDAVDD